MLRGGAGGFGLWSIADRVNEAGGTFRVDTLPGRGARFEMEFPLQRPANRADAAGIRQQSAAG
jgi:signal transduction histidine kinase